MLGTLLRLGGPPTREALWDLVLSWLVCRADTAVEDDDADDCDDCEHSSDTAKAGNRLVDAFVEAFWCEKRDGPLLSGEELFKVVNGRACRAYCQRIRRWLQDQGSSSDHITEEDAVESVGVGWIESCNLEKVTMPRRMARQLGDAIGGNVACDGITRNNYVAAQQAAHGDEWWKHS